MIYVITHKQFDDSILPDKMYQVLHVGDSNSSKSTYLRDDVDINISEKNKNYCELTGVYWIWKNIADQGQIVGIVHYRRYFTTPFKMFLYDYLNVMPKPISSDTIKNALKMHDAILPVKRKHLIRNNWEFYASEHLEEDLVILRDTIKKIQPNYIDEYDRYMHMKSSYYANMMICKKTLFDRYCDWLFSIMDELEKRIDITKYADEYQKRVYGFISERLLGVWIEYNKVNVLEMPVFNTAGHDENAFQRLKSRCGLALNKIFKRT